MILLVYDFEDFRENFDGEKRLLKHNLIREGEQQGFTIICIDFSEELTFILKSIINHHREGRES